jgi:hypothetical protein
MHTLGNLNFSGYTYFQAVVDGGATLGYKGETFAPANTVVINVAISKLSDVTGTSGDVVFLGKKRPEITSNRNSDGTWPIK